MTPFRIQNDDPHANSDRYDRPAARLDTKQVYEQMIECELRTKRLSPARRKRIVRYAAGLGLSAVEAGKLVNKCQARLAREKGLADHRPQLRLVNTPPPRVSAIWKIGAVVLLAVVVDLMVLGLLRP